MGGQYVRWTTGLRTQMCWHLLHSRSMAEEQSSGRSQLHFLHRFCATADMQLAPCNFNQQTLCRSTFADHMHQHILLSVDDGGESQ